MSLGTNYFINLHVKNEYYDVDKLIGFLDHHEVIPNSVFASCDRQFRGVDYHSHLLDTKKGYEPVDRSHFLARIPFYFYIDENPKNNCVKEPLELGTLISACIAEGYTITRMYFVLDRMFELGIKVRHIFSYYVMQAGEVSAKMFFMWYSYIEKAQNFGIEELMPERLITAYNEELEKMGEEPILYEVDGDFNDSAEHRENGYFVFEGRIPCDEQGKPIMRWLNIRVNKGMIVSCTCKHSEEGKLIIKDSPKLLILKKYMAKKDKYIWIQYHVGAFYASFDNEVLRDRRLALGFTQKQVAEAVGTSERTYQRWETSENPAEPGAHYLIRLLVVLGIDDIQSLIKYKGPELSDKEIESWEL